MLQCVNGMLAFLLLVQGLCPFFLLMPCGSRLTNNAVKRVTEIFNLLRVFFILLYHATPLFLPCLDERLRTMCSAQVWCHIADMLEWIEFVFL